MSGTTWEMAHDAVMTKFKNDIEVGASVPSRYENDTRKNPTTYPWARLQIFGVGDDLLTFGQKTWQHDGLAIVTLFGELGTGVNAVRQKAQAIIEAFRTRTENGVTYLVPRPQGGRREGDKYQFVVEIPFEAEEQE